MSKLNLDNNFCLEILNYDSNNKAVSDIKKLKLSEIRKKGVLLLKINFSFLNKTDYKKILRKLLKIKNIICNKKVEIGIKDGNKTLLGYVLNYNETKKEQNDFLNAVNAIFYNTFCFFVFFPFFLFFSYLLSFIYNTFFSF